MSNTATQLDPDILARLNAPPMAQPNPQPKLDPDILARLNAGTNPPSEQTEAENKLDPNILARLNAPAPQPPAQPSSQPPAQPQTQQPDSTWQKIKNFATHPLVSLMPEFALPIMAGEAAQKYLTETNHPIAAKVAGAYTGIEKAEAETARGMTSPENLAFMAGTGGLGAMEGVAGPVIARLANLGFSGLGIYQGYKNVPEIRKALQSDNTEEAARLLASTAGTVGMSAMAGLHAIGSVTPAEATSGKSAEGSLRNAPIAKIVENDTAKLNEQTAQQEAATKPQPEPQPKERVFGNGKNQITLRDFSEVKTAPKETPLRVFHGTSGDITDVTQLKPEEFGKPGTLGIGAYFSMAPEVSGKYAGPKDFLTGGRVIAGEIKPGVKLLNADAPLPEELQTSLEKTFGETGKENPTYRDFLESTIGDKNGIQELQKTVAAEGYRGVRAEDVHGFPGVMLFGEAVTGSPLKDIIKPTLPTAKIVPDNYVPVVSKDEILSEASARIARNSTVLQQILDPAKLQTPADIKTALDQAAGHIEQNLDPRVGMRISLDAQKQLASDLGMPIEDLLNRKSGEAFGPEQAIAARSMLKASADNVLDLAKKAAQGDTDARSQLAFAVARHQEISNQVAGVTSEAGRTLGSFRIKSAAVKIANAMAQLKPEAQAEAAKLLAKINPSDPNYVRKANQFINEITPSTTADKLFEVYRNSLLSSPATVIKKIASEATMMALEAMKKTIVGGAEAVKSATGVTDKPQAFASEGYWYAKGAAQALAHSREILSGEFNLEDAPGFEHGGEKAIKGTAGTIINAPTTLLSRMTNLIYAMNYYGELNSLAARQAIQEGLSGEELAARQEYLAQKPTKEMIVAANKQGLYGTFQSELGKTGKAFSAAIQSNPISRFFFPFFKTPVNLVKASGDFSPYGLLKGTAVGDLNLQAKGLIGSSIASAIAYLAAEGKITGGGPINFKQRETKEATGWQPYSVKIGDKYYQYSKAEPLGLVLGLVADAVHGSLKDEDPAITNSKAVNAWNHISRNVESLPFLMQISSIVDGLTHLGDGHTASRIVDNLLASAVVPAGVKNIAEAKDRTIRSPQGLAQTIQSRIPGMTQNAEPDIDITGQPVQRPASSVGGANPFTVTTDKKNPVTAELARLGVTVESLPKLPARLAQRIPAITPAEALKLQQQETQSFYTFVGRAIQNPRWKELPDSQKKLVISGLHKEVIASWLARLQQLRQSNQQ